MKIAEVYLTGIDPVHESTAVAAGKIVLDALGLGDRVRIADNDLSEAEFAEMVAYLKRRGVTVKYDHDDGFPIAAPKPFNWGGK